MSDQVWAVKIELGQEEQTAAMRVLGSGRLVQGEEVAAFEEEYSQTVSGRPCVAVNSGTSALHLGLLAHGIGPGDEVVVPSFTFAATANSVRMTGATPVFADIHREHFCLDPSAVRSVLTNRTRAIMPVHLYGHPAPMHELNEIARDHDLLMIEDACQAHGASLHGAPAGALGDVAAFSFYATKNMTTGEGGMVVCADEDHARRVRLLRNQGMERKYENEVAGLNNRMTEVAAAIGRVQLRRLKQATERRRHIAALYDRGLTGVHLPRVAEGAEHVYHQYTVRTTRRDKVMADLHRSGIDVAVYYPVPTHRLPAYGLDLQLSATDEASREVMSLPIHPSLSDDQVQRVISVLNQLSEKTHG